MVIKKEGRKPLPACDMDTRIVAVYGDPQSSHTVEVQQLAPCLKELCGDNQFDHLVSLVIDVKVYDACPDYTVIIHKTLQESTAQDIFQAAIMIHQRDADLHLIIHDPSKHDTSPKD